MKRLAVLTFLVLIIGNIGALDTESSTFIERLMGLTRPGAPETIDGGVLFTFSTEYRSVGIAFAHENFARIHWFQRLLLLRDPGPPPASGKQPPPEYSDPKVLFFAYTPPENVRSLEYRLIVNGLWTQDPLNPLSRVDRQSGLAWSVVFLPEQPARSRNAAPEKGIFHFSFRAAPGETVTVAGDFNNWDPFMYELREIAPGDYRLSLPLPPGTWRYVFYHQGRRHTDQINPRTAWDSLGNAISEVVVE